MLSRDGSCLGRVTNTDLIADCNPAGIAHFDEQTAARFCAWFRVRGDFESFGLKTSELQPVAWKGVDRLWVAPNEDVSVVFVESAPQLVGFTRKPCLVIATLSAFRRSGMPLKMVGTLPATVTRPVYWSTSIAVRA